MVGACSITKMGDVTPDNSTSWTVLFPTLTELSIKSLILESVMELTSDIKSELVDKASSHVSMERMVHVQWRVPRLAALALASQRVFLNFP